MADIEDFDLDRTTKQAWDDFTERLADVLSVMDASADLTISAVNGGETDESPPAVRFSAVEPGVIEAVLVGVDSPRLAELGWISSPRGATARRDQEEVTELANLTTTTMTEVVGVLHPIFLEPDQLAELLTARESNPAQPVPGAYGVVLPNSQAQLDAIVDAELEKMFGHPALRNAAGEVAIRVGSTMVFCRSTPDFEELVLFAVLVHDVNGRSRACEVLNDLRQALESISQVADGIDDDLAHKLGGRTTFPTAG